MWPFCGSEHYPDYIRYKDGYNYKNKPKKKSDNDLDNKFVIQYLKSFEKTDLHSKIKKQYTEKKQKYG